MSVTKIISGGQTGADQTGLEVGVMLGLETGGWAPSNWWTEAGPAPWLEELGLVEHPGNYAQRTQANAHDADATLIFGDTSSPGSRCTITACKAFHTPYLLNPTANQVRSLIKERGVQVLNVAGNRLSKNPEICDQVREVLMDALA